MLKKLNADTATTIIGVLIAGLSAANVDLGRLAQGDTGEIAKASGAALIAIFGYLTNKNRQKPAAE